MQKYYMIDMNVCIADNYSMMSTCLKYTVYDTALLPVVYVRK